MFLVGLTGGFLSGKSHVAKFFRAKGVPVIDVDKMYHRLLAKNATLKKTLIKAFGKDIATRGKISTKKLRKKVQDTAHLKRLNKITHPLIIKEIKRKIKSFKNRSGIVVVEAPLLYEAGLRGLFDRVVVVSTTLRNQLKRARRRGYSPRQARAFIETQMPLKEKRRLADYTIGNIRDIKELRKGAEKVLKLLDRDLKNIQKHYQLH